MSIDINEVSFKITENRWLEIWVGDQEIVSVDTTDGGVLLCRGGNEIGNIIENKAGGFTFEAANEEPDNDSVVNKILLALERIGRKL